MKQTKISIFKDLFKSTDVPYIITLAQCLERIRVGKNKDLIQSIQKANGDERANLKKKLPCIVFSGEFIERKKTGLKEHSGLMVIDLDKFKDQSELNNAIETLKSNKHIVTVFISPSGSGIKGVVRIPKCDAKTHEKIFKEFHKTFNYSNFDISNCNVDRVCFESYDPNIYINYNAVEFNPVIEEVGFTITERSSKIPIKDDGRIIDLIMGWNWTKSFVNGQRNQYLLDLASAFCEYGVQKQSALNYINNNVVIGDFSESEVNSVVNNAYKLRSFHSKYFEDYKTISNIKKDLKSGKDYVIEKYNLDEQTFTELQEEIEHDDFWYYVKDKIKIDPLKYKLFLERNGYKKYFPNETQKPTWVKIVSNIVSETSTEKIKDFVLDYLLEREEIDVWSYCANYNNLFSEQYLLMLETIELLMLKDQKDKSYIAYNNGILEVTKSNLNLIDYIDVDGYIWKNQIIKRDFTPSKSVENEYKTFINNISNNEPLPIECSIGFLLCTYKNKMNNKAVILNDEVISDNPEGGTGKGLLVQGLRQIRRVSILDGKSFDDKKSFPYQTVSQETQILVFDDVKKNFDFETKFSLVTEGMTLERKNKDAIKLTVEESPKMVISTNYAIKGEGNSHNRRRHEIEISQYYGNHLTPFDEFGRQLFDDWETGDFVKFDNYMVRCIQTYLKYGLIAQEAKNIKLRKFIAESAMEFYEWATDEDNLRSGIRLNQKTLFNNFVEDYPDFKRWLTQKKFNIWLKKYCNHIGVEFDMGKTNNERWFEIKEVDPF